MELREISVTPHIARNTNRYRWPYNTASRLCREPAHPQAD